MRISDWSSVVCSSDLLPRDVGASPRVVDEDVDPVVLVDGVLDHRLDLVALGDVGPDEATADLSGHGAALLLVEFGDHDDGSLGGEPARPSGTDPVARPSEARAAPFPLPRPAFSPP